MFKPLLRYMNDIVNDLLSIEVRNLLLLSLGCICMMGCNIINPKEQIPTYIKIDSFAFTGGSHNISSAWVYYNNAAAGVFRLPATVPILADKAGSVQIGPGIEISGIKDAQTLYPFYSFDTFSITPAPGQVIIHTPASHYIPAAKFPWKVDFESGSDFRPYDTTITHNTIVLTTDPVNVHEGFGSGYLHLTPTDSVAECVGNQPVTIPLGESYLEFDYKNNVPFEVGLVVADGAGNRAKVYQSGANPRNTWNKLYVSLQPVTGQYSGYTFYVLIRASINGQQDGYVLLDNLKVVTY